MTFDAMKKTVISLIAAAFIGLLAADPGPAGQPAGKGAAKAAAKAAKAEAKVKEVEVLKEAYVLMAMGNHDYDGHRVKAMAQVEDAIKILDNSILKDGTNGQKVVANDEEIATAKAAFIAKHQGVDHTSQAFSDLQMREAQQLLNNVHETLTKQPKVRGHVGNAIKHTETALKIR